MDGQRFDDLAKALSSGASRRALLKAAFGGAAAAIGLGGAAEARTCRSLGNSCTVGGDCCSGNCVTERRGRKICHCRSAGDCPAGDQCHPAACLNGACATSVSVGASCDAGDRCSPNGVCQADGSCVGTPVVCTALNECFTAGTCQPTDGTCSPAVYHGDGASCTGGVCFSNACCTPESAATTCSDGKCGPQTNNCGQTIQCLTLADNGCAEDSACCFGVCADGVCQAGAVSDGGACDSNGDCASHA